jgi:putative FmdB family regulatory protein
MPTYDYVCDACEHAFEEFQSINDKPLKKCPKCKKAKLRRLFGTGSALIFKGSGFYGTDYRSDSYKKAAQAEQQLANKPADTSSSNGKADTTTPTKAAGDAASASKKTK